MSGTDTLSLLGCSSKGFAQLDSKRVDTRLDSLVD